MSKIIGIDLGTTNSVVAVLENGTTKVISNKEGGNTTPSVVAFSETEILVGQRAKNQAVTNPAKTVSSIKRIMGLRIKEISGYKDKLPYQVVGKFEEPAKVQIDQREYLPQEISAKVLLDLKSTAESYLGQPVTQAVITVPAYFNDSQRQATKDAGRIAGLEVKRIINEPTAAALAYGFKENAQQNSTIVVFDLGGGTLDISILEIGGGVIEVKGTNGDTFLGGDDFDLAIQDLLVTHLRDKYSLEPTKDLATMQRLREAAEQAKKELSSSLVTTINIPFIGQTASGPVHLQMDLPRAKLEELLKPFLQRMEKLCKTALQESGYNPEQIDQIVLVGGSTRIPAVQHLLKKIFNKEPNKTVNPDEVVAQGAAIQAAILSGIERPTDIVLLDVTPLSLGIETEGGEMDILIPKNTPIPCSVKEVYTTAEDDQDAVDVYVYQGEHAKAGRNRLLAKFELDEIPPAEMGDPNIEVSFNIDTNGILRVTAKDLDTGKTQHVSVDNSFSLSEQDLQKMQSDAKDEAARTLKAAETREKIATAKALVEQTEKSLQEFEDKLNQVEVSALTETKDILAKAVTENDMETVEEGITAILVMWEELSKRF